MHEFHELVERCTFFTLNTLETANNKIVEALQASSATELIKALQMIQLQKVILAVGMFSIFEANLQESLCCETDNYTFDKVKKILIEKREFDIRENFEDLYDAINVLKHGRGRSYNNLVNKIKKLPFRVRQPDEFFFAEGDVSEVSTLIEVDDSFICHCSSVITNVSRLMYSYVNDSNYRK